ncbi:MAG TPA: hypothetical protein VIG89_09185 [Candidatus Acidoferrales bacterium]
MKSDILGTGTVKGGVAGDQRPGDLGRTVQLQAELVEWHMSWLQGVEETVVQAARMQAGAREPETHRGFREIEDARRGVGTEAFGDGVQVLGDTGPRRSKPVEQGVAPG